MRSAATAAGRSRWSRGSCATTGAAARCVTTERDVLRVNGGDLGFLLSFGTAVNYLRAYYALDKQGPWPAARAARAAHRFRRWSARTRARTVFQAVEADIEATAIRCRSASSRSSSPPPSIASRSGSGRPTSARASGATVHVLGGPIAARRLIRLVTRIYRGFPTGDPKLYDNLARRVVIRFFRPTHFMLDGDILPAADRLEVDVPLRVTLIRS